MASPQSPMGKDSGPKVGPGLPKENARQALNSRVVQLPLGSPGPCWFPAEAMAGERSTHFPEEETEAQGSHSSVRFQAQSAPREADITLCAQPEWPGDTSPMPGVPRLGSRHICSYPGLRQASPTPAARPRARGSWALLTTE